MPNQLAKTYGSHEPITAPTPIRQVCIEKPSLCWLSGKLSATKARKGSIATLKEASIIINIPAPTTIGGIIAARTEEFGINNKARPDNNAPVKKNGRLRPSRVQVRSL